MTLGIVQQAATGVPPVLPFGAAIMAEEQAKEPQSLQTIAETAHLPLGLVRPVKNLTTRTSQKTKTCWNKVMDKSITKLSYLLRYYN